MHIPCPAVPSSFTRLLLWVILLQLHLRGLIIPCLLVLWLPQRPHYFNSSLPRISSRFYSALPPYSDRPLSDSLLGTFISLTRPLDSAPLGCLASLPFPRPPRSTPLQTAARPAASCLSRPCLPPAANQSPSCRCPAWSPFILFHCDPDHHLRPICSFSALRSVIPANHHIFGQVCLDITRILAHHLSTPLLPHSSPRAASFCRLRDLGSSSPSHLAQSRQLTLVSRDTLFTLSKQVGTIFPLPPHRLNLHTPLLSRTPLLRGANLPQQQALCRAELHQARHLTGGTQTSVQVPRRCGDSPLAPLLVRLYQSLPACCLRVRPRHSLVLALSRLQRLDSPIPPIPTRHYF